MKLLNTLKKMEKRNIKIDIDTAREWYTGTNESLKTLALQAFKKEELEPSYKNIKTLVDVKRALNISDSDWSKVVTIPITEAKYSALVALIRKALHIGLSTSLWKGTYYYPWFYIGESKNVDKYSSFNCGQVTVIEEFPTGKCRLSVGGGVNIGSSAGLAYFSGYHSVGYASTNVGALGCISKEIAEHFGKYFYYYILKSWYGNKITSE